jgi:hypothetical protein
VKKLLPFLCFLLSNCECHVSDSGSVSSEKIDSGRFSMERHDTPSWYRRYIVTVCDRKHGKEYMSLGEETTYLGPCE